MTPRLPVLVDFACTFLPAAKLLLSGESPYSNKGFLNPPWVLYPILPLTILPQWLASLIWVVANLFVAFWGLNLAADYLGWPRSRGRLLLVAALTASPFSIGVVYSGQLSSLVLLGLVVSFACTVDWPASALLLIKPQIGLVPFLTWLARAVLSRDWRRTFLAILLPMVLMLPALVMAPDTLYSVGSNLLSGRYYSTDIRHITAPYRVLTLVGLPAWLWPLVAATALWAVWKKPTLPMVATATLLIIPYVRSYDNVLLLVPALLFIKQRRYLWIVVPLLCLPLFRLLFPPLNRGAIDGLAPIGMLALLVREYDLFGPLAERARSVFRSLPREREGER